MQDLLHSGTKRKPLTADLIAPVVLLGLILGYVNVITRSVNVPDESFYAALAHRFFLGDRPFADEWGVEQLSGLLLLPPFSVFYSVTHSTDGVVLFFRALYAVCQMLTVSYIYISLRFYANRTYRTREERGAFSVGALIAAAVFGFSFPFCIPTLSYYAMSMMGLAVLSVTLFCYPPHWFKYVFCGAVFSFIIMAEPAAILLYLLLALAFAALKIITGITKKQIAPHYCDPRFFLFLNVGGYAVFIAALLFLQYRMGLGTFIRNIGNVFSGTGYAFNASSGGYFSILLEKAKSAAAFYGSGFFIALACILTAETVFYKRRKKTRPYFALAVLVLLVSEQVYIWLSTKDLKESDVMQMYLFYGLPLYFSAPAWMLLREKPDRRLCCAWVCCTLFSAFFSLSSRVALGWGGIAASVFSVLLAAQTFMEIRAGTSLKEAKTVQKRNRLPAAAFCAACVFGALAVLGNLQWFRFQNKTLLVENVFCKAAQTEVDTKLETGPLRGITTTKNIADVYYAELKDLDRLKELCPEDGYVFVNALDPAAYLYLNRGYGSYSPWYRTTEYYRLQDYWQKIPDKKPAYIYFPYFETYTYSYLSDDELAEIRADLQKTVSYESIPADTGEILRVKK